MPTQTLVSVEDYLKNEATAEYKSEYNVGVVTPLHRRIDEQGNIVNMAGAQPAHNLLASRVGYLLQACLENTDCLLYIADQLVHLPMCERFTYPDVVIVCQKPVYTKSASGLMALANPAIIIEILSEGTEAYDRGEKFACYQSLDSLRQYILVSSQHKSRVEVYTRKQENHWDYISEDKLEARIKLGECDLLLKDIYKKVPLEE